MNIVTPDEYKQFILDRLQRVLVPQRSPVCQRCPYSTSGPRGVERHCCNGNRIHLSQADIDRICQATGLVPEEFVIWLDKPIPSGVVPIRKCDQETVRYHTGNPRPTGDEVKRFMINQQPHSIQILLYSVGILKTKGDQYQTCVFVGGDNDHRRCTIDAYKPQVCLNFLCAEARAG